MAADSIPEPITLACARVRPADETDSVAGVLPSLVASPASTAEASALLRAAAALGLAVIPRGTGTKLAWGNPPERADLIVETTLLGKVIEHAAGDLVATVEAGVSLDRLAGVLGAAGQRLALDCAGGTIGGVLATGVAGPLRLRYGTPRDLLIGITVVRADGTVAKSGGKVVKNVAGYDLGKLFAGSRGTLGLITQATFRLHPIPATTAYVTFGCAQNAGCARLLGIALRSSLVPVAAELHWPAQDAPLALGVAIEGDPAGVAERAELLTSLLASEAAGVQATVTEEPPAWWGRSATAAPASTVLQVAFWPGDLGSVLIAISATATQAGLDPVVGGSAGAGLLHVTPPADAGPGQIAGFVTGLRAAIGPGSPAGPVTKAAAPPRASVTVQQAPAALDGQVDRFGPVPSLGLMRAVKQQFDPDRRMSPGRFAGGL